MCNRDQFKLISIVLLALAGCTPQADTTTAPTVITDNNPPIQPTTESTEVVSEPSSMPPIDENREWQAIDIPEAGLHFEIPAGWFRNEPAWEWVTNESVVPLIGAKWQVLEAGTEPEAAMFPVGAVVQDRVAVDLGWVEAFTYTVNVDMHAAPAQTHTLMIMNDGGMRTAYDLYIMAGSAGELASLQHILDHMLATLTLSS